MKILLVRFRQIGDALLSSVLCNSLKKSFPDSQIDYVVYDFIAPLFYNHPYIDNVITITSEERKNPFKYFMKAWKVTRAQYDIVIDLMGTPRSELFTLLSPKAKFRIGPYGEKKKIFRGDTYTHGIFEPKNHLDQCDKFLKLLTPLETKYNIIYDHNFVLGLTSHEKIEIKKTMNSFGIDFSKKIFIFSVNSRRPEKVYPIENMKKLINLTLDKYPDCQIILFYSPDEKEFVKNFHKKLNNNPRIFSDIETKSVRELGALISQCDLFVGNEGGPRHLSQAINIPSLSIWRHNSGIKDWLPNKNDKNRGISTEDFKDTIPNYDELNHWEKYALITPEKVLDEVIDMVNKYVKK